MEPRSFPEAGGVAGPSGSGRPGVTMCSYSRWMGVAYSAEKLNERLSHLGTSMPREHHKALIRFRLGCWDLEVSRLARASEHRPRAERTCRVCQGGGVEDERHVLLECPCYAQLRQRVGLPVDREMHEIMLNFEQAKLGGFLWLVHRARRIALGN